MYLNGKVPEKHIMRYPQFFATRKIIERLNENGENEGSLAGLVIDKEDINKKYHKYVEDLDDIFDTDNLEKFSKRLTQYNKETLLKIRRLLNGIKECETEFILSRATDYAKQIDHDKNQKMLAFSNTML